MKRGYRRTQKFATPDEPITALSAFGSLVNPYS